MADYTAELLVYEASELHQPPPIDFSVRVIVEPHTIDAFEGKNEVNH